MDTHITLIPAAGGATVPTPMQYPFAGVLQGSLSPNVNIEGMPAAVEGSVAVNQPAHIPEGGPFQDPPSNQGTVSAGSETVSINGKAAARNGDPVATCTDEPPAPGSESKIVSMGTVLIG